MDELLFKNWQDSKDLLDRAKKAEMECRVELCADVFGDKQGEFKVVDSNVGLGRVVTLNSRVSINCDMEVLGLDKDEFQKEAIENVLSDYFDHLSDEELACFDVKVSLNLSRYKKLEEPSEELEDAISVTPATPTVSVKYEG